MLNLNEYWHDKYLTEFEKLKEIEVQIKDLAKRREVVKKNVDKYHQKYMEQVSNEVLIDVVLDDE